MKIIDLLNKIANGEKVPKKIKYNGTIYEKFDYNNKYYDVENNTREKDILSEHLASESFYNDEVEVCSTGLTVKEAEENLYKFSEALHKEANKKREKEDEILDNLEGEKKDNFTGWKMYQDGKEVCSMDCSAEEEKKIPEKLDIVLLGQSDNWTRKYNKNLKDFENTHIELNPYVIDVIRQNTLEFQSKINEILDYLDYLKSKGE